MQAIKLWGTALAVALAAQHIHAATQPGIDKRLVGQWQGQSDIRPENRASCQFKVRTVERMPDGQYVVTYFSDEAKQNKIGEVKGRWWSADRTLYLQPPGVTGRPESYRYYMIDRNTVRFENTELDVGSPCPDDNTLIDTRIVQE